MRNPYSTRPYQHVLEPLKVYLMIAKAQYEDNEVAGFYNVGPDDRDCITTGQLVDIFVDKWNQIANANSKPIKWINKSEVNSPHEANFLKLDCSKIKKVFGWKPRWSVEQAIEKTVEWSKVYLENGNVVDCMNTQIEEFYKH